jgi:hypothetical protein
MSQNEEEMEYAKRGRESQMKMMPKRGSTKCPSQMRPTEKRPQLPQKYFHIL